MKEVEVNVDDHIGDLENYLFAIEKEESKSNLAISKLDMLVAIVVSGKLQGAAQQDLETKLVRQSQSEWGSK